jgi:hypothetical protein
VPTGASEMMQHVTFYNIRTLCLNFVHETLS